MAVAPATAPPPPAAPSYAYINTPPKVKLVHTIRLVGPTTLTNDELIVNSVLYRVLVAKGIEDFNQLLSAHP